MIDLNFTIPHERLQQIFERYKIKAYVGASAHALAAAVATELLPQSTQARYLIGGAFWGTDQAVIPQATLAFQIASILAESYDINSGQGSGIFPSASLLNIAAAIAGTVSWPLIWMPKQWVINPLDIAGIQVDIIDDPIAFRIDYLQKSNSKLYYVETPFVAQQHTSHIYIIYAEGTLKPGVE